MKRTIKSLDFLPETKKQIFSKVPYQLTPRQKEIRRISLKLYSCQERKDGEKVLNILDDLKILKIEPHSKIYGFAINALVRSKMVKEANQVFEEMKEKGFKIHKSLITFLINAQKYIKNSEKSIELFNYFIENIESKPESIVWSSLFNSFVAEKKEKEILEFREKMKELGIQGDYYIYGSILKYYSITNNYQESLKIVNEMKDLNLKIDSSINNMLLNSIQDDLDLLLNLFNSFTKKNKKTWGILFSKLIRLDNLSLINEYYEKMKKDKLKPDSYIFKLVLLSAQKQSNVLLIRSILKEMSKFGVKPNKDFINILVETRKTIKQEKRVKIEIKKRQSKLVEKKKKQLIQSIKNEKKKEKKNKKKKIILNDELEFEED